MRTKRPDTLGPQSVAVIQVAAQVEDFHGTSVRAVHLKVGYQPPTASPELRRLAPPLYFRSQGKQFLDALLCLQGACGLTFTDVSAEVAIRHNLRALSCSCGSSHIPLFHDAPLLLAV